jgi:hemolysin III
MTPSALPPEAKPDQFSLPLFIITVLITLAGLLTALRLLAPGVWTDQFLAPPWKGVAAFLAISLLNCFQEYSFHRYVLHQPAIRWGRRLYRQHTRHHALTRIGQKPGRAGRSILFIENKYPIATPEQGEASFFPWYSLAIFAGILTPLLALLQWLLPSFPWFFFAGALRNRPRHRSLAVREMGAADRASALGQILAPRLWLPSPPSCRH